MRIHVDLLFNKPLRRGGNIVNLDGSKTWVTFKYEGLPCFCFQCGLLGHDDRHCGSFPYSLDSSKQYGDWHKAGANSKGGMERLRALSSGGQNDDSVGKLGARSEEKTTLVIENSKDFKFDQGASMEF